jgi:hypothetical protein
MNKRMKYHIQQLQAVGVLTIKKSERNLIHLSTSFVRIMKAGPESRHSLFVKTTIARIVNSHILVVNEEQIFQ